jgi:hypothetical protein
MSLDVVLFLASALGTVAAGVLAVVNVQTARRHKEGAQVWRSYMARVASAPDVAAVTRARNEVSFTYHVGATSEGDRIDEHHMLRPSPEAQVGYWVGNLPVSDESVLSHTRIECVEARWHGPHRQSVQPLLVDREGGGRDVAVVFVPPLADRTEWTLTYVVPGLFNSLRESGEGHVELRVPLGNIERFAVEFAAPFGIRATMDPAGRAAFERLESAADTVLQFTLDAPDPGEDLRFAIQRSLSHLSNAIG